MHYGLRQAQSERAQLLAWSSQELRSEVGLHKCDIEDLGELRREGKQ